MLGLAWQRVQFTSDLLPAAIIGVSIFDHARQQWQLRSADPGRHADRLGRTYNRLCRKLARMGLPRAAHQGPLAYAQFIGRYRPDRTPRVWPLLEEYAALRFGLPSSPT